MPLLLPLATAAGASGTTRGAPRPFPRAGSCGWPADGYLALMAGLFATYCLHLALDSALAAASLRGAPFEPSKRWAVVPLLYSATLPFLAQMAFTGLGVDLIIHGHQPDCWPPASKDGVLALAQALTWRRARGRGRRSAACVCNAESVCVYVLGGRQACAHHAPRPPCCPVVAPTLLRSCPAPALPQHPRLSLHCCSGPYPDVQPV